MTNSRPPQVRKCKTCNQVFATPNAFMGHKRPDGACRPVEVMVTRGFHSTAKGWVFKPSRNTGDSK